MISLSQRIGHWKLAPALQLSVRSAAAAALALFAAQALHLEFPIYALIAAVIVTELSTAETRRLGTRRLVATMVGAILGAVLSDLFSAGPVSAATGIGTAMFIMHATGFAATARVAGYVVAIVMLQYHEHPWIYAWYRFYETVLGILSAIAVSYVPMALHTDAGSSARART